jgi:excisionase family DNA binding protein
MEGLKSIESDSSTDVLLTPSEAAAMCRVIPKTITRWACSGKLPTATRTIGGHRRFRKSDIERLIGLDEPADRSDDSYLRPTEASCLYGRSLRQLRRIDAIYGLSGRTVGSHRRYSRTRLEAALEDLERQRLVVMTRREIIQTLQGNREILKWWINRGKVDINSDGKIRIRVRTLQCGIDAVEWARSVEQAEAA